MIHFMSLPEYNMWFLLPMALIVFVFRGAFKCSQMVNELHENQLI